MTTPASGPLEDPRHRAFLIADAHRALDFFDASARGGPGTGFHVLDGQGCPLSTTVQELHTTTRLVHSYALAQMAGRSDGAGVIDRGMDFLWRGHRDRRHGGYLWAVADGAVVTGTKLAYGHVFVALAAASAKSVGHPDADRLLADVLQVIEDHFWDENAGRLRDEFTRDWQAFSGYRGMNANMHGVEAFLAVHEAGGAGADGEYLRRAGRILDFFIAGQAAGQGWRIPEHYDAAWRPDFDHAGDPMFRPAGTTPGHSFEMARLLLQHWDLAGRPVDDVPHMARNLVRRALADAWDRRRGGLAYTLDRTGRVAEGARYWWPVTEAIGALAALQIVDGTPQGQAARDRVWYRRLWQFADAALIDHEAGGWWPEQPSIEGAAPDDAQFAGKPDLYHALQADLFSLTPGLSRHAEALASTRPLAARARTPGAGASPI